ncbi:MAG: dihydrolipoamide acetyltransferase family protein, partial [Candidatus Kapaibacterium sp.]
TILRWLKQPGDTIERDEVIAEISTDKVDTEIPSPAAGTLLEIVAQENETVGVGNVIAYISSGNAPAAKPAAAKAPEPQPAPAATNGAAAQNNANGTSQPAPAPVSAPAPQDAVPAGPIPRSSGDRFYSPLVRSIATKEGLSVRELDAIAGSGQAGRVTKDDVTSYLKNRPAQQPAAAPPPTAVPQSAPVAASKPAAAPSAPKQYGPDVEVVPMDRMRQLIAEHMVRSKQTSPHVTEVGESDVTDLVRLRELRKDEFQKREGIKLTFTPFFIAAIAKALRDNPWVNSSVDGTNIIVRKRVNVGVATALPDGNLIVPVIKDADRLNVSGLAHAVNDLATRARNKSLMPDEIAGGTFTLTNYGVFGLLHGAPIINQPQVAILGTGAIQKRPVVREVMGQDLIVIRSMVYLSLSHDHRVIDGLLGGKFLADVIKNLEGFNENTML